MSECVYVCVCVRGEAWLIKGRKREKEKRRGMGVWGGERGRVGERKRTE